jgi:hypothetical protein
LSMCSELVDSHIISSGWVCVVNFKSGNIFKEDHFSIGIFSLGLIFDSMMSLPSQKLA